MNCTPEPSDSPLLGEFLNGSDSVSRYMGKYQVTALGVIFRKPAEDFYKLRKLTALMLDSSHLSR